MVEPNPGEKGSKNPSFFLYKPLRKVYIPLSLWGILTPRETTLGFKKKRVIRNLPGPGKCIHPNEPYPGKIRPSMVLSSPQSVLCQTGK